MIFLRKFYNADTATETGTGGEDTAVIEKKEETVAPSEKQSIAALLAKEGSKTTNGKAVEKPQAIEKKEAKEETKTTETETPAATANEEVKVANVDSEAPKPTEKAAEAPKPQTETENKPTENWQEVIKSQQPKAILQAIGFDEKMTDFVEKLKDLDPKVIGLLQAYKDGKTTEYLKELSTDYSKMPPEEVMRHQLREEYPKASEKQLDILYKKEVVEKYSLDSDDEDTVEEGKLLLEAKADKYRDSLLSNQEKYLLPKPSTEAPKEQAIDTNAEKLKQQVESFTKQFNEDPYTQSFLNSKDFVIGEGTDKIKIPIDAKAVADLAINGDNTGELIAEISKDEKGNEIYKPKSQHQLLVATVNKYGMGFIDEIVKQAKSLGGKKAIEPIENAKQNDVKNTTSTADAEPKSIAELLAKKGVANHGGT